MGARVLGASGLPPTYTLCAFLELVLDIFQVFGAINLNDAANFTCVPHELLCARIQHLDLAVASDGQIV